MDAPGAARTINENPAEAERFVAGLSDEAMEAVGEAALARELTKRGIPHGPHRSVPDPLDRHDRLIDRISMDLIEVRGLINTLYSNEEHERARAADQRLRDILAQGVAECEAHSIPDTIEGLT